MPAAAKRAQPKSPIARAVSPRAAIHVSGLRFQTANMVKKEIKRVSKKL
jgi:hypothetical protein